MAATISYSPELAMGGNAVVIACEEILQIINKMRVDFEAAVTPGYSWRNYNEDILVVFENISSLERETLYLIQNMDIVRHKNDDLLVAGI